MYNEMNLIVFNRNLKIPLYIKLLCFILLLIFIFSFFIRIDMFDIYEAQLIKEEDKYFVQVYVPVDKTIFFNNTRITIDKKEYEYEILNIDKNYVDYDNKKYMIVKIYTKLEEKYLINNNYIILKQKNKTKKLFELLFERIKKGINL